VFEGIGESCSRGLHYTHIYVYIHYTSIYTCIHYTHIYVYIHMCLKASAKAARAARKCRDASLDAKVCIVCVCVCACVCVCVCVCVCMHGAHTYDISGHI
jgi:hypothetical protein